MIPGWDPELTLIGCSLVVLFSVCEEVLAVRLRGRDVQRRVHSSAAHQRPLQAGAVLLQAAPQLVVQSQQLRILSFKGLLQEGRGCRDNTETISLHIYYQTAASDTLREI